MAITKTLPSFVTTIPGAANVALPVVASFSDGGFATVSKNTKVQALVFGDSATKRRDATLSVTSNLTSTGTRLTWELPVPITTSDSITGVEKSYTMLNRLFTDVPANADLSTAEVKRILLWSLAQKIGALSSFTMSDALLDALLRGVKAY